VPEIRWIPLDVDRSKLRIDHVGYDHRFAEEDINVNLPFDRLSELVEQGEIGSIARETPVLMGLQPNVAPLIRDTIPELVARFQADSVEAALLVPS
jgi:D-proline reductase (dithiol) PrdB